MVEIQPGELKSPSGFPSVEELRETSRLSSEMGDSSAKQSRTAPSQKGMALLLRMIPIPERHAMAAARGIVIICTLVATIFAIYHFWPKAPEYGGFPMTDNMVDVVDIMFLCAYFLPFGVAILLHQALVASRTVDESVIDALAFPDKNASAATKTSTRVPSWSPWWKLDSKIIGSTTKGEVVVIAAITLANLIWWFVPVIISLNVSRYLYAAEASLDGKPDELTVREALNRIFGWAGGYQELSFAFFFFFESYTFVLLLAGWAGTWDACLALFFVIRENVITKAVFGRSGGQYHTGVRFHIFCGYAGKVTFQRCTWSFLLINSDPFPFASDLLFLISSSYFIALVLITLHSVFFIAAYVIDGYDQTMWVPIVYNQTVGYDANMNPMQVLVNYTVPPIVGNMLPVSGMGKSLTQCILKKCFHAHLHLLILFLAALFNLFAGFWNFYGMISWICLMVMAISSVYKVRRLQYQVFYYLHW
jgi:hypothetical protein